MGEQKKDRKLTLGSLFDGSGGFMLAGVLAGIEPIWKSEIEPFPIAVTNARFPKVKHYGDVSLLNGAELPPVDIITWGSPCQGLSLAGLRKGLADERSGLYVQAVRIVREMLEATNGEYPKFCVFENVPGLLSSNAGEDFLSCMNMMQDLKFIPDINLLDAQYMGVAQRRKRVYITWSNVEFIVKKRTIISDSITLQLLTELSLLNLDALLKAYSGEPKKSGVQEKRKYENGLKKRINLFSLQKENHLERLQKNLEEIQASCLKGRTNLDLFHGEDRMGDCMSTAEDIKSDVLSMENLSMNIGQSLKSVLEEGLHLLNESTTLTLTKETMTRKIFFCFQVLLNTLLVTIRLTQSLKQMPMCLNFYEWVGYALTEIRGYIDAECKYLKGIEELGWNDLLRFYKQEFSRIGNFAQSDITEKCGREILPIITSLSGYSAESFSSWQKVAGTSGESVTQTSYGVDAYNSAMDNAAASIGTNCGMSTGRNGVMILNDQGGNRMDVTEDKTCTLRAESHHPPLLFENHSQASRYRGPEKVSQTVLATFGSGGNNQPFVLEDTITAGFCTEHSAKSRGIGYEEEVSPTLRAGTVPAAVSAFGICAKESNAMKSDNPNSGFYEAKTSRTIDTSGINPSANQGGVAVVDTVKTYDVRITSEGTKNARQNVYETNISRTLSTGNNSPDSNQGGVAVVEGGGTRPSHRGDGYKESEIMYTLNTSEKHAVAYGIDRAAFNQGKNALYNISVDEEVEPPIVSRGPGAVAEPTYTSSKASFFTNAEKETANTLVATDYKDPPIINDSDGVEYIIRRLTPIECGRLQGFPDFWCDNIAIEEPTEEDMAFWRDVFETHRKAVGTSAKPKSDNQIRKWLKQPYSDSAAYRMWGNGISLPCGFFVLAGIAWAYSLES